MGVPLSMDREVKNLVTLIKRDERACDGDIMEEDVVHNTTTTAESRSQTIIERDLSRAGMVTSQLQPRETESQSLSQRTNLIPMLSSNRSALLESDGEDLMEHAVGNR